MPPLPRNRQDSRRTRTDAPRRVAYDVLRAVAHRQAYANLLLPNLLRERRITGRDAGLATELAYGTLRAQGTLDRIVATCAQRPLDTVDAQTLDLLRLGAYQLLRTRIPAHAAVSTTVELARQTVGLGPSRFVNAVLRRVAEQDGDAWDGWVHRVAPSPDADPIGHLAVRYAHPEWIVAAFRDALGGDLAETARALAADEVRPEVHLVALPGMADRDGLVATSGGTAGPWSPYAVRLAGGDPARLAEVRNGHAHVQDEGSQLCARALTEVPLDGRDDRWLDLCAGPGGKASVLGALARRRGNRVLAVERSAHRAGMVRSATAGMPVCTVVADGTVPVWPPATFDRVLVDAPCTGLGSLRRRPEARWRRQPSDLPGLTRLQRALLTSGLEAVRSGGVVCYVTCSPHVAETRAVVTEVARRTGAQQLDARPYFPDMPDLGAGPQVQLWPHRHGTDAMFCAVLRRP